MKQVSNFCRSYVRWTTSWSEAVRYGLLLRLQCFCISTLLVSGVKPCRHRPRPPLTKSLLQGMLYTYMLLQTLFLYGGYEISSLGWIILANMLPLKITSNTNLTYLGTITSQTAESVNMAGSTATRHLHTISSTWIILSD